MIRRKTILPLIVCAAGMAAAASLPAEEADIRRCLTTRSVQNTYVLNDLNVLFVKTNKQIYLNVLPNRCPGLGTYGAFSYTTTTGSLCSFDHIRVMNNSGLENQRCRIGEFRRVTKDEIRAIVNGPDAPPANEPPATAEPETVVGEDDETDGEENDPGGRTPD